MGEMIIQISVMKSGTAAVTTAVIMLIFGGVVLADSVGTLGNDFSLLGVTTSSLLILFAILTFIFVHGKKYRELFFMIIFTIIAVGILAISLFAGLSLSLAGAEIFQEILDAGAYIFFIIAGLFGLVPFIFSIVYFILRGKEKRALKAKVIVDDEVIVYGNIEPQPNPISLNDNRSLEAKLIELRNLYTQGLITAEEFERKRQELLSRY